MKKLVVMAALLSATAFANEEFPAPEVDFVKETLEYCQSTLEEAKDDKKALLACINAELEFYEYKGFSTLEQVIEYAESAEEQVPE